MDTPGGKPGRPAPQVYVRRAFSYEWRLWTVPELTEALSEAGFTPHGAAAHIVPIFQLPFF